MEGNQWDPETAAERPYLSEEEIVGYSQEEVDKIVRVNQSIAEKEQAIANKESQKKLRILFERAAEETLPFIVYVMYDAGIALLAVLYLLNKSGAALYIGAAIILTALLAPILLLPHGAISGVVGRIRKSLNLASKS